MLLTFVVVYFPLREETLGEQISAKFIFANVTYFHKIRFRKSHHRNKLNRKIEFRKFCVMVQSQK